MNRVYCYNIEFSYSTNFKRHLVIKYLNLNLSGVTAKFESKYEFSMTPLIKCVLEYVVKKQYVCFSNFQHNTL